MTQQEQFNRMNVLISEIKYLAEKHGSIPRLWPMDKQYREHIVNDYLIGKISRDEIINIFERACNQYDEQQRTTDA